MKEPIRRVAAYAAAGRANGEFASSIYSYAESRYTNMSESYDYDASVHLGGVREGNIYHYGEGAHISLEMSGNNFKGFDYSTGSHFSGSVSGRSVQLFDYEVGRHFSYSV